MIWPILILMNSLLVHFGSATAFLPGPLQEAYTYLLEMAIAKNMCTCFDPNYRHLLFQNNIQSFIEQAWNFLGKVNFFKVSDEEAMLLTDCNNINDAIKILSQKTKAVFAVTLGEKGALIRINDAIEIIPTVAANVIDTTGAGDAFVGAILYQLNKKTVTEIKDIPATDWKDIVYKANNAAAKTCEHFGAMEAFLLLKK